LLFADYLITLTVVRSTGISYRDETDT
jgi:hypothetical protein